MKRIFLLTAVLLGAVSVSQAGVHLGFGFNIPLGPPAIAYQAPPVCAAPAPVYYSAPAPVYYSSPPVVCAPPVAYAAPSIYLGFGRGWCGAPYRGGYYGGWGYRGSWGQGGWGYHGGGGHGGWHR